MNEEVLCSIIFKCKNLKQPKPPNIREGLTEVWYFHWRKHYLAITKGVFKEFLLIEEDTQDTLYEKQGMNPVIKIMNSTSQN